MKRGVCVCVCVRASARTCWINSKSLALKFNIYWSQCHEETVKSGIWSLSEMNRGWRVKLFKKVAS